MLLHEPQFLPENLFALLTMLLSACGIQCVEHVEEELLLIFPIDMSEFLHLSLGYIALNIYHMLVKLVT